MSQAERSASNRPRRSKHRMLAPNRPMAADALAAKTGLQSRVQPLCRTSGTALGTIGSLNSATAPPRGLLRFSEMLPPALSTICLDRASPIPEPPSLVVKNGTKRFGLGGDPGPRSRTRSWTVLPEQSDSISTKLPAPASAALRMRLISAWLI